MVCAAAAALVLLVALGAAAPGARAGVVTAAATTYYVDSGSGSDSNAGTSSGQAWRTLAKASAAPLGPGDRLLLRRGRSWTGSLAVSRNGTSAAPIVVGAYGSGALPLIRGDCVSIAGARVVVRELHVDACDWAGIELRGDHDVVEQSLVTHNAAGIFVGREAVGTLVLRNELRDNNRMSVLTQGGDDDSGAFGILIQGDGTEVAHNAISGSDAFSHDYGRDGAAIEVYGARNSHVHHNVATDNDVFTELGDSRAADNTYAYNVVRSSLERSRFIFTRGAANSYGPVRGTRLYNNTVLLTGARSEGVSCWGGCGPDILTMRGNVVQAVALAGFADAPFDEDYDLFSGGPVRFPRGSHSLVADPGFVDPAGGNLRLRATSPAIDKGTSVPYGQDFDGRPVPQDGDGDGTAAFDIGAFELPARAASAASERGTDATPPALRLRYSKRQRALRRKGVVLRASCPTEPCALLLEGRVWPRGRARTHRLRSRRVRMTAGGERRIRLRLTRRAAAALRARSKTRATGRCRVRVTATDAAGNRRTKTAVIRLRR